LTPRRFLAAIWQEHRLDAELGRLAPDVVGALAAHLETSVSPDDRFGSSMPWRVCYGRSALRTPLVIVLDVVEQRHGELPGRPPGSSRRSPAHTRWCRQVESRRLLTSISDFVRAALARFLAAATRAAATTSSWAAAALTGGLGGMQTGKVGTQGVSFGHPVMTREVP
jgi:hypothetical protein